MGERHAEDGSSRGEFRATTAGVAALAIGAGVWAAGLAAPEEAAAAAAATPAAPGGLSLELDGILVGLLKAASGGRPSSDVIEEKLGAGRIAKKHIGNIKFDDVTVRVGFSMSKAIYDWISASWDDQYQRKNGAIHAADSKKNVKHTLEFFNALLTETTIPACDASSKEPAYLTLKFAPELTRSQLGTGKLEGAAEKKQKLWTPSAFRLAIDGLPCNRVSKIESLTIKQLVTESAIGDIRDYEKEPAKLEIPNLKITFDEADIGPWSDWFDHFVVQGFSGEADEKNGTLTFLAPNLKTALAHIELKNLGIFKLSKHKYEAAADASRKVTAELYCERMSFKYG